MVASITKIANGIYKNDGRVISVFIIGINISVPCPVNFNINNTYNTDIIRSPSIFALGFNPLVLCNTSFLKSSTNPTIPNPIVRHNIGIRL